MENNNQALKEICKYYEIDYNTVKLIRSNSNLIYDCGDIILRVTDSRIRNKEDIKVELDWVNYLRERNVDVVRILNSKNKNLFEKAYDDNNGNHFIGVCFEKIKGEKLSNKYWNNEHFQKLGVITGKLHRIGNEYNEKSSLKYKNWDQIVEHHNYVYLPEDNRALKKLYFQLVAEMNNYSKRNNNYGLIHYDVHHGNYLLTKERKIILFDFEMVCKSWYMNDISTILYYAHHFPKSRNDKEFERSFMHHFWKGYEREYAIEENEKEWIPKFLLYRDLLVYGYIRKIWKEKLSEQQKKYQEAIERSIEERRRKLKI